MPSAYATWDCGHCGRPSHGEIMTLRVNCQHCTAPPPERTTFRDLHDGRGVRVAGLGEQLLRAGALVAAALAAIAIVVGAVLAGTP